MIAAVIRWSARNVFLIGLATIFVTLAGIYAVSRVSLDAIPDLSDVQVIVYTEYPGQAPQVVEDQVTYPLTTAMLSVPKSQVVRGVSFFGVSFVYVIFEDGTDLYWARSRVLEYLNSAARRLPSGVAPSLGPDATGVGWVYQYVVRGAQKSLADLRTIQDWYVRFGIAKAEGVAEVASVGGFVKQYSVIIDPRRLQALRIPLARIREALRTSNMDVGGRTVELAETEFAVRGRGYIKNLSDLEQIVVKSDSGVPVLLKDVARIELTPDERRGITEMDGEGEVVSGIVLQRFGENALSVIRNVKGRLAEIAPSLPQGVTVESVYDRSDLIYRAIDTLKRTLIEESAIVALVCVVFLLHVRSALVAIITLPLGVLIAYLCMHLLGLSSNIMSLGGIAIAIGAMVDAAIVMIENAHKHLERAAPGKPRAQIIIDAASEVGPALFFSLLVITVSFLPIFALEAQEGRLFKPLAYTKTFAMAAAALLSVTLVPALMILFVRGRIMAEHKNPVNRLLIWLYRPTIRLALRFKTAAILVALAVLAGSVWPALRLGTEFMPNLNEGTLFYMPTTLPGLSVTKAAELVQTQDKIIKSFPEVASVWGKAGRASTATDPAPIEMFETVINLKPESEWRPGITVDKLIAEMDRSLQFPGVSNAWTMPIKARIDMLSTGIRTPVGVKVLGTDLAEIEKLARQIEAVIRTVPGTTSAYAERVIGGYYLHVDPDRAQLARYGLMVGDLQNLIAMALGAEAVTTTVEGRERYTVSIRYPRDYRSDPQAIANEVLIPITGGGTVPLGQVAKVSLAQGPASIRTENAQLAAYIFVDFRDRDVGGFVADVQKAVASQIKFPPGYYVTWSGQFEYLQRAKARLQIVVPVTILIIFLLLYLNFRRAPETLIIMLSVPFALVGGIWLTWWLGFNLSVAAAVGFIALAGVAAETGVVMLLYLDHAYTELQEQRAMEGQPFSRDDLYAAIMAGAVERVRPKMMTVCAIMAGLLPIMWSDGTGAEVMQRIAVPMIGGMVSSTLLTLIAIPAIYGVVKGTAIQCRARRRSYRKPRGRVRDDGRHDGHDGWNGLDNGASRVFSPRRFHSRSRCPGEIPVFQMMAGSVRGNQQAAKETTMRHMQVAAIMTLMMMITPPGPTSAEPGNAARGERVYRACVACHSLEPNRNMTGPSLAEIWNRQSGSLASFPRYSPALKSAGVIWNDDTLDEWIKDPQHFIAGNTMTFPGIKDARQRADLLAFLKEATQPGRAPRTAQGGNQVGGMMMGGGAVPNLKTLDPQERVRSITHCGDTYKVATADGKVRDFWERNLRFKTDVSEEGPGKGAPALVGAGMMGDRADVIFASPDEISGFIAPQC